MHGRYHRHCFDYLRGFYLIKGFYYPQFKFSGHLVARRLSHEDNRLAFIDDGFLSACANVIGPLPSHNKSNNQRSGKGE